MFSTHKFTLPHTIILNNMVIPGTLDHLYLIETEITDSHFLILVARNIALVLDAFPTEMLETLIAFYIPTEIPQICKIICALVTCLRLGGKVLSAQPCVGFLEISLKFLCLFTAK